MLTPQFTLTFAAKLVVVLFAGAGGSCTGIEQAIRRHVDIAANHNEQAISCHRANHPQTTHHIEDVRRLDPRKVTGGLPVGYFHASPDCTHFSQAKGGQPRSAEIRSLPWVVPKWGGTVQPDVITLENVKEIQKWGRLIAKRDNATGRVIKLDGTVAEPGVRVPRNQQFLVPDPAHEGKTWRRYLAILRGQGYQVEVRVLCAADYGVPTTRSRLFLIARRDGLPITWPEPTHFKNPKRGQKKWVAAHTCIDFTLPGRSIFEREKPLADATLRRVARGMKKFVLDSADPFIVPVTHSGSARVHDIREPLRTVTTAQRGEFMVASPVMIQAGHGEGKPGGVKRWGNGSRDTRNPMGTVTASGGGQSVATACLVQAGYGERAGQAPRALDLQAPLGTVVAGGGKHALVTAFVEQANGGFYQGAGNDARLPMSAITTTGSQQRLVSATLVTNTTGHSGRDLREPTPTLTTGQQQALVEYHLSPEHEAGALRCAAFLLQYYSEGGQWSDLRDPANSITTRDRLALVTVWIKGDPYVVVDICLRMLTPRELANASSFPPQYVLSHGHDGRVFTKSQQVFFIGNAVPPLLQQAVTTANYSDLPPMEQRMAA
jgi:DNA (cytosine-5)-methyltransferase 1